MNGGVKGAGLVPGALVPLLLVLGSACGRGDGLGPSAAVVQASSPPSPVAVASPSAPSPTPNVPSAPPEDPEPAPDCIHASDHGVDSVSLAVYFLECGGRRIPGSRDMVDVPLGCRIHFNATPRDGMGVPTCSRTWPVWQVGPEDLVRGGGLETFTPAYTAVAPGTMSARCIVDGVRSDWIVLNIVAP